MTAQQKMGNFPRQKLSLFDKAAGVTAGPGAAAMPGKQRAGEFLEIGIGTDVM